MCYHKILSFWNVGGCWIIIKPCFNICPGLSCNCRDKISSIWSRALNKNICQEGGIRQRVHVYAMQINDLPESLHWSENVAKTDEAPPSLSVPEAIHYDDVIMGAMASQITSLMIVYSTVYSGADQRKHQSSASLAFVWGIHRGPVNSSHKWPVMRKMFPFDDVIMRYGNPQCIQPRKTSPMTTLLPLSIIQYNNHGLVRIWWSTRLWVGAFKQTYDTRCTSKVTWLFQVK